MVKSDEMDIILEEKIIKKMQFKCVTSLCKQSTGKNSIKSSSVSNHVLITPNINKKLKYLRVVGNELTIKSIQHTIIVDGMVIQCRENGGQKRLLEQISGEQLSLQNVSHRFGRFIMIIGRVLRIILKTPLT